jgi:phage baseplate assembly protein W|tara:strand:+ start:2648 stop:3070 length:423 start_codon:yes stop_codon:yes gene_type:complete
MVSPATIFTPRTKKITLYQDFKKTLEISPVSSDLTVWKDEDSVKESMKNLILTDRGERLMQPNLGGNINAMLFENITPAIIILIQNQVRNTIELYEPRAELIDVVATSNIDDNTVRVRIVFYITNVQQPITLDVFLERTR